ncbi:MAG: hypothetical protein AAGB01_09850 [Cyanobacteria bacterium P01_F01_bin.42]
MWLRFLLLFIFASPAVAEETCCIDDDMVAAFGQQITYSRSWPDSFPIDITSPSLDLVGSSVGYGGIQTTVAWRSKLDPPDARELVSGFLTRDDWQAMPQRGGPVRLYQHGFISSQQIRTSNNQQFCRGRDGQLTISARRTRIGIITSLAYTPNRGGLDCDDMIASHNNNQSYQLGLQKHLPALKLPESIKVSPYNGISMNSGSRDAHASLKLKTSFSSDELMATFKDQMVDQGWAMDAQFLGDTMQGHTWVKNADGLMLTCIVTATVGTANEINLRMHLEPA